MKTQPFLMHILVITVLLSISCSQSDKISTTLSPTEERIGVVGSSQTVTLELMETHRPVTTRVVSSESDAIQLAESLGADVIQLILRSTSLTENTSSLGFTTQTTKTDITYRFWKRKSH